MTEKELKRLKRDDLIDIIYALKSSETDLLARVDLLTNQLEQERTEVSALKKQMEDKRIRMDRLGSVAEVAADVSGLMDAAQRTADIYTDEAKTRKQAAVNEAQEILTKAKQEAVKIILKAKIAANKM